MKKIFIVLFSLVALFGFMSCEQGTTEDPATVIETTTDDPLDASLEVSTWKIKSSAEAWSPKSFSVDASNSNILLYKLTGLRALEYQFSLVNAAGGEMWLSAPAVAVANVPFTMDDVTDAGIGLNNNATFTALKTTYLVKVDISAPSAPVVTLIAGPTDSTSISEAELAAALMIRGELKTINGTIYGTWADGVVGTYSAVAHTVTWTVTGAKEDFEFILPSLGGDLKGATMVSPAVLNGSVSPSVIATSGDNFKITGVPNRDSVLTIVVTIDAAAEGTEKYSIDVNLTAVGSGGWVITNSFLASELMIKGDMFSIGWTDTAGVYTAGTSTVAFEVTLTNKTTGSFGFSSNDGFIKCSAIASPVTAGASAAAVELVTTGSGNATITDPPMNGNVYTISVLLDSTKAVNAGRYMMTVTLKTLGTTAW